MSPRHHVGNFVSLRVTETRIESCGSGEALSQSVLSCAPFSILAESFDRRDCEDKLRQRLPIDKGLVEKA